MRWVDAASGKPLLTRDRGSRVRPDPLRGVLDLCPQPGRFRGREPGPGLSMQHAFTGQQTFSESAPGCGQEGAQWYVRGGLKLARPRCPGREGSTAQQGKAPATECVD